MPLVSVADILAKWEPAPPALRDTNPTNKPLTWDELTAREPRLAALYRRIAGLRVDDEFCAHEHWFGRNNTKGDLQRIVGWYSDNEDAALRTRQVYEVAHRTLYNRLPYCRHEGPCRYRL